MNRRNFMKTFALAVGASPLALAAKPEVPFERLSKDEAVDRWYYIQGDQFIPCKPPVNKRVNELLEHDVDGWFRGHENAGLFYRGVPIVNKSNLESEE